MTLAAINGEARGGGKLVAFVFAVALICPSPAIAGSLARTVDGSGNVTYTFSGGAESNSLTATRNVSSVTFTDPAAAIVDGGGLAAALCTGINTTAVTCPGSVAAFVLAGNAGNDTITVNPSTFTGPVTLNGGAGVDTLTGAAGSDVLDGGSENDTLNGNDGADTLTGVAGNDTLTGGDGSDVLDGGSENDTLNGGTGNDMLTPGIGDDNTVTGGDDIDTVSYDDGRTQGVTVDLADTATQSDGGPDDNVTPTARENLVAIENVTGSSGNDLLTGDAGPNTFVGGLGSDSIAGAAGVDVASYVDRAAGHGVVATLDGIANDGEPGEIDSIGADIEDLVGGGGDDMLIGNATANALFGGEGADTIAGLGNVDTFAAGVGDDTVEARDGNAENVDCGPGTDGGSWDVDDAVVSCEGTAGGGFATDSDNDGSPRGVDCNDSNSAIRPGAIEVPGNGVDEDCDGRANDFPLLGVGIHARFRLGAIVRVRSLELRAAPAGATASISCRAKQRRPKGGRRGRRPCPFTKRTIAFPTAATTRNLTPLFRRARLPVSARIEIQVTAPATIGKLFRYQFRRRIGRTRLSMTTLCLRPGAGTPTPCQ